MLTFLKQSRFRIISAWVLSVIFGAGLAIIFSTQNVIGRLEDAGAHISFAKRLSMTVYDLTHMGALYGVFIAIAFTIAFLAGGVVYRFTQTSRTLIYIIAGGLGGCIFARASQKPFEA